MGNKLSITQRLLVRRICQIQIKTLISLNSEDFEFVKEKFEEIGFKVTDEIFTNATMEQIALYERIYREPQDLFGLEKEDLSLIKHVLINHIDTDEQRHTVPESELRGFWRMLFKWDKINEDFNPIHLN